MLIKLSASCLAAVGAKSADEFPDALVKVLNDTKSAADSANSSVTDLQSKLKTANDATVELKTKISAQEKTIGELSSKLGNPEAMTESRITEIAKAASKVEGSRAAVEAVGAVGAGAPPAAPSSAGGEAKNQFEQLVSAKKYEEAFAAAPSNSEVKKEFSDSKSYAAFMKFNGNGQVKITAKNK